MSPIIVIIVTLLVIGVVLVLYRSWANIDDRPTTSSQQHVVSGSIEQQARMLVADGKVIEAIKLVREATGMELAEAKASVDALRHALGTPSPEPPKATSSDGAGDAELEALLAGGNTITAIKRVRELTGLGLKEAKEYVDALRPAGEAPPLELPVVMSSDVAGDAEFQALLAGGNTITAIKRVRELTGLELKEAKEYVDGRSRH